MKKVIALFICLVMFLSLVVSASAIKVVQIKNINVDKASLTLGVSYTYKLNVVFTPANTNQKLLKYSTSDKNIASVDANGLIQASKVGKAVITVTSAVNSKITAKVNVTVTATDSSDLPTWSGKQLKLQVWDGQGTGNNRRDASLSDIVTPEVKRITGVELDKEGSFDNGGQDFNSKLALLAASNDFPDLLYNGNADKLIEAGKIYDLTDLLPKYCPNIMKLVTKKNSPNWFKNGTSLSKRLYEVPMGIRNDVLSMTTLYSDLDLQKYNYIYGPTDTQGDLSNLWVRDDILKLAYPNAKTQKEIDALYLKNGKFTRDQIYDIPLKNYDDVVNFFYKIAAVIKDKKITENGKPVYATYINNGGNSDSWPQLAWLSNMMQGAVGINYFTYWDAKTKNIELALKQPWFKKNVEVFNKFVRDGVAPKECVIDTADIFTNKVDNGEYAITYAWTQPNPDKLNKAKKPYAFRKVYIDIAQDTKQFVTTRGELNIQQWIRIFKGSVKEADLPQVLKYLDFLASDIGMKLETWGPRTTGLWTEKNGKRTFTNKIIEDGLVYGVPNGSYLTYNLAGDLNNALSNSTPAFPPMPIGIRQGGLFNPKYTYDRDPSKNSAGDANKFFASGLFDSVKFLPEPVGASVDIWNFFEQVPEVKKFWDVRGTGFEPVLVKCMISADDAAFEKDFKNMLDFLKNNHLTDSAMKDVQDFFKKTYPEAYETYVKGY